MYCSSVSHGVKVVKMTEGEVIQRWAAGRKQEAKWLGATGGLAGVSSSAAGFSHVPSKTRPLAAMQGRRAEFGEKWAAFSEAEGALDGKLLFHLSYFMFFSILRVCTVYSVEQVPCGSCQTGSRDLLAGEMGSDNLFLQQVQLGLLLLEGTLLVQSASAEDPAHDILPGGMNLWWVCPEGPESRVTYSVCIH